MLGGGAMIPPPMFGHWGGGEPIVKPTLIYGSVWFFEEIIKN